MQAPCESNIATSRAHAPQEPESLTPPANRARLETEIAAIDAMPGDESSKALQKMMRLMPVVSDVVGPALEAHGFGKEDLMTVTAQMQGLGAEDPSITADTMKLMDAVTQGKIEPLFA